MVTLLEQRRERGRAMREATAARREEVARLTAAGLSITGIAQRLGINKRLVVRDREAMKINHGVVALPLTPAEICRALELLDDGCPLGEVAETLGRGRDTISRRFRGYSKLKVDPLKDCRKLRKQLGLL